MTDNVILLYLQHLLTKTENFFRMQRNKGQFTSAKSNPDEFDGRQWWITTARYCVSWLPASLLNKRDEKLNEYSNLYITPLPYQWPHFKRSYIQWKWRFQCLVWFLLINSCAQAISNEGEVGLIQSNEQAHNLNGTVSLHFKEDNILEDKMQDNHWCKTNY
jgi:hypothetical protein